MNYEFINDKYSSYNITNAYIFELLTIYVTYIPI